MKKFVRGFDEVQEEAMGVFALVVIKSCHCPCVEEPVKELAAVSPLVPVFHDDDVPGVLIHAEPRLVNGEEP